MNNRRGFTLVEIIVTVAILGILTTVAVASVSNLTKKARSEKDNQNVNTLKMAAESYAQANKEYLPKLVGEWTTIDISELKNSNYIKEEIRDQNDKSCMSESYVDITKVSKKEYIYQPHLICEGKEVTPSTEDDETETNPEIIITINGLKPGEDVTSENLINANYSIVFKGDKNNKDIGILSYNYSMLVKNIDKNTKKELDQFEVFNSGNQIGNNESEISVKNININNYLNLTGENEVIIKGFLVNNKGIRKTETSKIKVTGGDSIIITDDSPPSCPTLPDGREGEPDDTNWLNKKDINDGAIRQISLICNDKEGSGCKRQKFSKTWPNKTEKNAKKSIKDSTITLTDNNNNSIDCNVNVNIDVESPELSILKDKNIKNTITVKANNNYNQTNPKETIESNDDFYNNLYQNKWLNASNYSNGIEYSVEASDDIEIKTINWETKNHSKNGLVTDEQINIDPTNSNLPYEIDNDGRKKYYFKVKFIHDGEREGTLTVEDKAGNKSTIIIKANLDKTPPTKPIINMYKWKESEPKSGNGLLIYNQNNGEEWSNKNIFSEVVSTKDFVSGIDEESYTSILNKSGKVANKNGNFLNITEEGQMTIKYKVCDNASNCIETDSYNIWIDKTSPTCTNEVTSSSPKNKNGWITEKNSTVTITAKCEDTLSKCKTTENISHVYSEQINTKYAGAGKDGGSVIVEDNAGNKATCEANQEIKMDWEAPSIPEVEVYKWKSNDKFPTSESDIIKENNKSTLKKLTDNCITNIDNKTCDWIDSKVFTRASNSTDNISGIDFYKYTTTGTTTNETDIVRSTRNIETDGKSTIIYSACDKAGNCSSPNTSVVHISKYAPTVTCKLNSNGKITDINIKTNGGNYYFKDCSKVTSDKSNCISNSNYETELTSMATTSAGIKAKWGDVSLPDNCGRTYYGYVRAKSVSNGKETIAKCSGNYSTKKCDECSANNPEKCPWVTSCRNGNTTLYRDRDIYAWAGTAYHSLNERNDRIYVLQGNDADSVSRYGVTWVRVYIPSYNDYYGDKYVYIAKNCLGPYNKVCPYTRCPG